MAHRRRVTAEVHHDGEDIEPELLRSITPDPLADESAIMFEVVSDGRRTGDRERVVTPNSQMELTTQMAQLIQFQQQMVVQQNNFMATMTELVQQHQIQVSALVSGRTPPQIAHAHDTPIHTPRVPRPQPEIHRGNQRNSEVPPRHENSLPNNPRRAMPENIPAAVLMTSSSPAAPSGSGVYSSNDGPQPGDSVWKHVTTLLAQRSLGTIAKPGFAGQPNENPHTFLERFTTYARSQHCTPEDWLVLVIDSLRGYTADWANINRSHWASYDDFSNDLIGTFWSEERQRAVRQRLANKRYHTGPRQTFSEYFARGIAEAKHLTPPIPEATLVGDLMQHLPTSVRAFWAHSGGQTIREALQFLHRHEALLEGKRTNEYQGYGKSDTKTKETTHNTNRQHPYPQATTAQIHHVYRPSRSQNRDYRTVPPPSSQNEPQPSTSTNNPATN